jgi:Skp family chaperone for outer membrane proteins
MAPSALRILLITLAASAAAATASAQPVTTPIAETTAASRIEYASVSKALAALEARDGESTVVTHPDGWVVISEPAATAQWSFTPPGYYAYPAVVRRIIRHGPNRSVSVDTASLCEADAESCAKLLKEFETMNERITQAAKARAGSGATQP